MEISKLDLAYTVNYDIIIIGAGPAGSTIGTLLAQKGRSVLLIEKDTFPRYRVGESLLPATARDLADLLGIKSNIAKSNFVVKRGATFSWGATPENLWHLNFGGTSSEDAVITEQVPAAYNVPRAEFDQLLIDNAIEKGVEIRFNCRFTGLLEENGRTVGVTYSTESGELQKATSQYVIDASGRQSRIAKNVGKRTLSRFFSKIAVWGYYENAARLEQPLDGNTFFQMSDDSWIWFIPLSKTLTSVGIVQPASSFDKNCDKTEFLHRELSGCPKTAELLSNAKRSTVEPYAETRICGEYSYCHSRFWQPGLVLIGDAACFVDVLLSSGVHLATYSAVLAAQSLHHILDGTLCEDTALNEYESQYRREYAIFFDGLIGLYDMQRPQSEYAEWLRGLLVDTSGIAFIPERGLPLPGDINVTDIAARTYDDVTAMRHYNDEQVKYEGAAGMKTMRKLPTARSKLVSSPDMREWHIRA